MEKPLISFRGLSCSPGVMAQDITSWAEMKQVYRQLKRLKFRQLSASLLLILLILPQIVVKIYLCNQNGIEDLGDLGIW